MNFFRLSYTGAYILLLLPQIMGGTVSNFGAFGDGGAILAAAVVHPGAAHAAVVVESSARGELSCLGGSRGTFPLLVLL